MTMKHWLIGTAGALLMGLFAASAQAAPVGSTTGLKDTATANSAVDQVRHRCYRHRGHWHCRRHAYRYYDYGYAPYYYGYGPGISLYFGGGRRHHHHGHHRRWR